MKNIGTILQFVLASALLYVGAFLVLIHCPAGPYPALFSVSDALNLKGGNTWQKFQEFDPARYNDVIFIGSSHAYRGYDPRIFEEHGVAAFNLGTSSQTMVNSYFIIEEYLTKDNTGTIILDVYAAAFELSSLEATSDLTQNITSDKAAALMAWALKDPRGMNMITLRMLTKSTAPYYLDTTYRELGFSQVQQLAPPGTRYPTDQQLSVRDDQMTYFVKILELAKDRGIDLVIANHPAPQQTKGPKHAQLHKQLAEIAKKHGIPYIDLAYDHPLDAKKHFYDHTHLNQQGVDWFCQELLRHLQPETLRGRNGRESPVH